MSKHRRTSDDPALDPSVRTVLDAAAAPVDTTRPLPGEDEALAAFRAAPQRTSRTSRFSPHLSAKAALASAIGTGVLLTGGVGAAAAGVLPGPAQDTVSTWLKTVGISVPAGEGADENTNPGSSGQAPGEGADGNAAPRDSEDPPGAGGNENGDPPGRTDQAPEERGNENVDPRGRSEQAPGERGNGNGDRCAHSDRAPGERGDGNDGQRGRSEQAPGERGNGSGDPCGRSEQAPGERGNGNDGQRGRSEETPGEAASGSDVQRTMWSVGT